jgi:hypothetical protein
MIDNSEMNKEMPKNMNFKQKNQDVYVQIDRFYSAKRALSSIRSKVEEIDSTLNKIRETRIQLPPNSLISFYSFIFCYFD